MNSNLFRYVWRHSWREQIGVLALVVLQLPFLWASFDLPKIIVNDAIQGHAFKSGQTSAKFFETSITLPHFIGGQHLEIFPGLQLEQIPYLLVLSFWFLVLVFINGWFKFEVNNRKGVLGERMLRRMRFELFERLMRFPPEEMRTIKAAEITSMIKDEVEPIGGFIGDAFIQPAFLGQQALTALFFILSQNIVMGMVALVIVAVQGIIIPRLRVEQLRLGRQRQLQSRELAGRIAEMIEGSTTLHAAGAGPFVEAEIGGRLGRLFTIRVDLFKRKFFVKYLNNLLAQLTPFFFYVIGGYFAIRGQLNMGQLIAVINAYRELPPPIKELIDWDQQRNDVTIKYEQVVSQFSSEHLLPPLAANSPSMDDEPDIVVQGLRVAGRRSLMALDRTTVRIEPRAHVAIIGNGSGLDAFMRVIGRQLTQFQGRVEIGGVDMHEFSDAGFSKSVAYVGSEPQLFPGSIRDNIILGLQRCRPEVNLEKLDSEQRSFHLEAQAAGNPVVNQDEDWTDYVGAGVSNEQELNAKIFEMLKILGVSQEVYRLGLYSRLQERGEANLKEKFVYAREMILERLIEKKQSELVEIFDPERYHRLSSIGDNILFGVASDDRLGQQDLASDSYIRTILRTESLLFPLSEVGLEIARWTIETFTTMRSVSMLVERFSLFQGEDIGSFQTIIDTVDIRGGIQNLPERALTKLLSLALLYIEPQHRLGLIDEALSQRILRARRSFRRFLPAYYHDAVEFYKPGIFIAAAPISDNLLFGRINTPIAQAERRVLQTIGEVLHELHLDRVIFKLSLDRPVGLRGRSLDLKLRVMVELARALIQNTKIIIIDRALNALANIEAQEVAERLSTNFADKMLIIALPAEVDTSHFSRVVQFEENHIVVPTLPVASDEVFENVAIS